MMSKLSFHTIFLASVIVKTTFAQSFVSNSPLSQNAWIGIFVAVIVILICLFFLICCFCDRRYKKKKNAEIAAWTAAQPKKDLEKSLRRPDDGMKINNPNEIQYSHEIDYIADGTIRDSRSRRHPQTPVSPHSAGRLSKAPVTPHHPVPIRARVKSVGSAGGSPNNKKTDRDSFQYDNGGNLTGRSDENADSNVVDVEIGESSKAMLETVNEQGRLY